MNVLRNLTCFQEEGARLRRKLEKHKKTEGLYSADEVLMEEIKEYKVRFYQLISIEICGSVDLNSG